MNVNYDCEKRYYNVSSIITMCECLIFLQTLMKAIAQMCLIALPSPADNYIKT